MEHLLIKPNFVKNFSCVGSACEDSCCFGWNIQINKANYKKVTNHPELKALAKSALKKVKKSDHNWAQAILDDKGGCQFLDEKSLCQIHAKAGEQYLSNTCQTYPRLSRVNDGSCYESLSLSCPEAVRMVLLKDDAFMFETTKYQTKKLSKATPQWASTTYDCSMQLLLKPDTPLEVSLLAIGILMKTAEAAMNNQAVSADIDNMYQQLVTLADSGVLKQHFDGFDSDNKQHKLHAFSSIHLWLNTNSVKRGRERFEVINRAIQSFADADKHICFDRIDAIWHEQVQPLLAQYPTLFQRYGFYYLYQMNFPLMDKLSPTQAYRLMMADFFMLRVYLTAMAHYKGELTEADLVMCFQVYHTQRQHKLNFSKYIIDLLDECGFVDVPAVISLLAAAK
ncbi:flagellin lysine-N-methylase [Shewanella sp. 10N.286.48.A6]|uniref:flagellin lysine-N-methylase n=1 Tax=Shewanella sp. 10N.286.48.A6 TaxID=1880833 RepID=UPI000C849CE8|nr:flagellin lysine-N-methylase [Shewanella sp. 10N.286.48.A6]PMH98566.1 flagellar biosynthesis protein [Shewanella sp. 10N.286.48.A6]